MGIRFACSNGHKLNVKADLAGKRGKCPQCGVKIEIPLSESADAENLASGVSMIIEAVSGSAEIAKAPPTSTPVAPTFQPTSAAPPTVPPPPPPLPVENWYLRTATGEQLGPSGREVLSEWKAAGLLASEAFVWREGWPDWRRASEVPELGMSATAANQEPAAAPEPTGAAAAYLRRKQRAAKVRMYAAIGLIVLVLTLLVVFLLVVMRGGESASESGPTTANQPVKDSLNFPLIASRSAREYRQGWPNPVS